MFESHNFLETPALTSFLAVVVELIETFLCSIKVVDYAVPASTVERVVEMMDKLKNGGILGLASMLPQKYVSII